MAFERRDFSPAAVPTTLSADITDTAVSLSVADGASYVDGSNGKSVLTIDRGKSNEERILYTTRVGNTFSGLTRGYNGVAAHPHTAGAIVEHTSTEQDFDEANAHIADPSLNHHTQYVRFAETAVTFTGVNAVVKQTTVNKGFALGDGLFGFGTSAPSDLFQVFNGTGGQVLNLGGSSGMAVGGPDHYFGANALAASGSRVHLGSLGDPTNAYIQAENSAGSGVLVLRAESGVIKLQNSAGGSARVQIKPTAVDPGSGVLGGGEFVIFVDEAANALRFRYKYADGTTVKIGSVALV